MSTWFTDLEDVAYTILENIPLVGTVYSVERAIIADREHDKKQYWLSVANSLEGIVRDVILFNEVTEITTVALFHTMAESFTDKMIEIYHHEPNKPKPKVKITKELDEQKEYVLINEPPEGNFKNKVFKDKAKGVHHFRGAVFIGTLTNSMYAPNGEKIRLDIPHGLYDGALVIFSWKWTQDARGVKNRPEYTLGRIQLVAGTPTEFTLSSRKCTNGWEGYDFWGQIKSKNKIIAKTKIIDTITEIVFKRVSGT